jgi:YfiH family protein
MKLTASISGKIMTNISSFSLDFRTMENEKLALFPFIMDGQAVEEPFCLISSLSCGDMVCSEHSGEVNPNRQRLFNALYLDPDRVAFLKQVHSRKTIETDSKNLCRGVEADGLITAENICLSITVADCLPIYLFDSESCGFALLHSGWKGTGIVLNALELMKKKWATRTEAVAAVLGPCIRSCCYKVDKERAEAFEQEFGESCSLVASDTPWPLGPVTVGREDGIYLDLQAANARLLAGAGVRNIAVCTDCTFTDERLGSFRREGPNFTHMIAMTGYF